MTAKKKVRVKKLDAQPDKTKIEVEVEGVEIPKDIPISTAEDVHLEEGVTKEKPAWLKWLNSLFE